MSTPEWDRLMGAPWGKFDEASKEQKKEAQENYQRATAEFWAKRGKAVPTHTN